MPMYEYKCDACEAISRALQNIGSAPPPTCPECGKSGTLERIMSVSNFHLKGGGWFDTGYDKVASSNKKGPSEGSSDSSGAESSSASSDSSSSPASTASSKPASTDSE